MKSLNLALAAVLGSTGLASAGGIDRSANPYAVLFEDGNYVELGFAAVRPTVTGDYPAAVGGGTTADMTGDYVMPSIAFKLAVGDRVGVGFFHNTPFGADSNYGQGFYSGLTADWDSKGSAVLLSFEATDRITVYGGARQIRSQADIAIPDQLNRAAFAFAGSQGNADAAAIAATTPPGQLAYTATTEADSQSSLIVGAAYERPEIALRVGLTFEQGFTHEFASTETLAGLGILGAQSVTEIEMPDTWILDVQTGIAPKTLLFGSVRHAEWSVWEVRPAAYDGVFNDDITEFENDVTTYRIGVGRQVTDAVSVFARAVYEQSNGGIASRLSPTDGTRGIGIGGSYSVGGSTVTAGIEYQKLGDAVAADGTSFEGSDALALGITFGHNF